jgi:hypothetical protein
MPKKKKPSGVSDTLNTPAPACPYHEKKQCLCIEPVRDPQTLKKRLEHAIRLNTLSSKFAPASEVEKRANENTLLQKRLDLLV